MSHNIDCYRCGASLSALSLPLSRQDQCPDCTADLHVCKMCVYFDAAVPRQCREDGAEDVTEKERVNFCDWFKPSDTAFDPNRKSEADAAKDALAALFEDG
ncbi:MAG: hypothetical protein ACR2QI_07775 [Woeseiaceae bacterium]